MPSLAQAAPGDLLVVESNAGSVVDFSAGGDLSAAPRFATGLGLPVGLCIGPGGDIYVAEAGDGGLGQVTVITQGGDFTDAPSHAEFGGAAFAGLWCDEDRILLSIPGAMPGTGVVVDVAEGGAPQTWPIIAVFLAFPVGFAIDNADTIYSANGDIWDITAGGDFTGVPAFATGRSAFAIAEHGGTLLAADSAVPEVFDFSAGGDMTLAPVWATLPDNGALNNSGVDGFLETADGRFYALLNNEIFDITGGGDFSADAAFAFGLVTGNLAYHGMLEHICSVDGDCADGDLCNGNERCVGNACLPPDAELVCDDQNVCTADSCDPDDGCSNESIAGCCEDDGDCAVDELCDDANNECVPAGVPTSGTGGSASGDNSGTGPGPTSASGSLGDGDSSGGADAGGADGGGDGCACSALPNVLPPLWLLVLAPWVRRRG